MVLDLEDAVPSADKPAARSQLVAAAAALRAMGTAVLVRVNPPTTPWFADDVGALPPSVGGVVVPKFEPSTLAFLTEAKVELPVLAGIETVRGVLEARQALVEPVAGCYFGAEDYVVDLGGVRTAGNAEVEVARSLVGMAARLAGVPAYDMIVVDFGDTERFRAEAISARRARLLGQVVHPPGPGSRGECDIRPVGRRARSGHSPLGGLRRRGRGVAEQPSHSKARWSTRWWRAKPVPCWGRRAGPRDEPTTPDSAVGILGDHLVGELPNLVV